MKDRISEIIASLQWALRANDVLSRFSRICFILMLGLCLLAIGMKMLGASFSGIFLLLVILGAAAVSAPALWRYPPKACALLVDRRLGLDERLSTCLEQLDAPNTPFVEAQRRDTIQALEDADLDEVKRLRSPRELLFAGAFAFVLAVILLAPNPVQSEEAPEENRALQAKASRLEKELSEQPPPATEKAGQARKDLAELFRAIRQTSDPEQLRELLERLERIKRRIEGDLSGPGLSEQEKAELTRLSAFLAGAARGLARHIDPAIVPEGLFAPRPETDRRIRKIASTASKPLPGARVPGQATESQRTQVQAALAEGGWDPRYDPIIRQFYGEPR
jgi:hypothetical protein